MQSASTNCWTSSPQFQAELSIDFIALRIALREISILLSTGIRSRLRSRASLMPLRFQYLSRSASRFHFAFSHYFYLHLVLLAQAFFWCAHLLLFRFAVMHARMLFALSVILVSRSALAYESSQKSPIHLY